jgi:hypothetical protein
MTEERKNANYGYEQEDEINLLDYVIILLKHKWMIFFLVFIAGVAAVIYSLRLPEIYRSESTIVPIGQEKASLSSRLSALGGFGAMVASQVGIGGAGSLEKFEIVLKSRELTNDLVEKHKLMPVIFKDSWDEKTKTWKTEEPPTIRIPGMKKQKHGRRKNLPPSRMLIRLCRGCWRLNRTKRMVS